MLAVLVGRADNFDQKQRGGEQRLRVRGRERMGEREEGRKHGREVGKGTLPYLK